MSTRKKGSGVRYAVLVLVTAVVALEGFLIADTAGQPSASFVAGAYDALMHRR